MLLLQRSPTVATRTARVFSLRFAIPLLYFMGLPRVSLVNTHVRFGYVNTVILFFFSGSAVFLSLVCLSLFGFSSLSRPGLSLLFFLDGRGWGITKHHFYRSGSPQGPPLDHSEKGREHTLTQPLCVIAMIDRRILQSPRPLCDRIMHTSDSQHRSRPVTDTVSKTCLNKIQFFWSSFVANFKRLKKKYLLCISFCEGYSIGTYKK